MTATSLSRLEAAPPVSLVLTAYTASPVCSSEHQLDPCLRRRSQTGGGRAASRNRSAKSCPRRSASARRPFFSSPAARDTSSSTPASRDNECRAVFFRERPQPRAELVQFFRIHRAITSCRSAGTPHSLVTSSCISLRCAISSAPQCTVTRSTCKIPPLVGRHRDRKAAVVALGGGAVSSAFSRCSTRPRSSRSACWSRVSPACPVRRTRSTRQSADCRAAVKSREHEQPAARRTVSRIAPLPAMPVPRTPPGKRHAQQNGMQQFIHNGFTIATA